MFVLTVFAVMVLY